MGGAVIISLFYERTACDMTTNVIFVFTHLPGKPICNGTNWNSPDGISSEVHKYLMSLSKIRPF